jgi:LuxR family transcriptional regulator, maltose regulon positive regulatory protein
MSSSTAHRRNSARQGAYRRHGPGPDGLLGDKLAPPRSALPVLPRPRLFERLNAAACRRVTVLDAPAGAGKTLLLDTWLNRAESPRSAWLSLDRDDDDPRRFWRYVVESLRRGPTAEGPLTGLAVPEAVGDTFLCRFIDAASRLPEPVTLVLDDVHVLRNPDLVAGVETLVRHAPAALRLVLSGRGQPAVPLARLRVSGDVADIGFDDLACDEDEARQLSRLLGMDLTDPEIDLLRHRTEGWMTGLRLAALWWADQRPGTRQIAEFSGEVRLVADYFDDEVLHGQSPQARRFMLRTSLVETLHGALADALTGEHDGARRLDELERENALVTAIDPHRTWFRYRTLLRDFLRSELNRLLPDEVPLLHRRAARWYTGQGEIVQGVRSALAGDDTEYAARVLVDHGHRLLAGGHAALLAPLVGRIPDSLVGADPALAAFCAHIRLRMADPDGAEPYLRVAEPPRPGPDDDADGAEDRVSAELRYADLRLVQASLHGRDHAEEIKIGYEVLDRAEAAAVRPAQYGALGGLAFHLGLAHIRDGHGIAARKALERGLRRLDSGAYPAWREHASVWHLLLNATEGRLVAAEKGIAAAVPPAPPGAGPAGTAPLMDLARSLVWLERNRLHDAWAVLGPTPAFGAGLPAGDGGEMPLDAASALFRARILIARRAHEAARSQLAVARRTATGLDAHLSHGADLLETEILTLEGHPDQACRLLDASLATHPVPGLALDAIARGRVRIALADLAGAVADVTPCLDGTARETRLLDTVAAHLVAAAANRRLGAPAVARDHLEQALTLAEPDGLLRVFLDAGRSIRSMLTVMIPATGPHAHMRAMLLQHFEAQSEGPVRSERYVVTLTDSETAVLRYLPSQLTNEEIASDLCLSVNTIKSHLRTLYRKLGVTSRREAITKARELDLLS